MSFDSPENVVAFQEQENNEERAEKLGTELYYSMQKVLDEYQSVEQTSNPASIQNPELISYPGYVESILAECWEQLKKENRLETNMYIQSGAGNVGNSCGLWNPDTDTNYPIYDNGGNYGGEITDRISDRLICRNMKIAIKEILDSSLAAAA